MIRIIYLKAETGYCLAEVMVARELDLKVASLKRYGAEIICIFDVGLKSILHKSSSFDVHLENLKADYPNSFAGKLLNMLSGNRKPSFSQIMALEQLSKVRVTQASSDLSSRSTKFANTLHAS
jgi:hypothetical protein